MNGLVLSGMVGILLALLDFFGSILYSSRITMASKVTSVALTLGGFIGRLGILSLIFYALSQVKSIHFQITLLSFVLCFTLCLVLKTMFFYRKLKSVQRKSLMG
ncbi:MAG: hypothetical protein A2V86_10010 [Deltaproteobacteria bacterium RBG_16_49_23]|nr:MAG: hypothetical protein A2V86_10010 [Deltaproteobacteria bacterium RBG_16_49_23]